MPFCPYANGVHPARVTAPGMQSEMRACRYSHSAESEVRSWPVVCTASSAGTDWQRVSAAPGRTLAAVIPGGRMLTETLLYLPSQGKGGDEPVS